MKNNLLDKQPHSLVEVLLIILLTWYVFFYQLKFISNVIHIHILFVICIGFILFINVVTNLPKYLKISKRELAWLLFLFYSILNSLFSPYRSESVEWVVMLVIIYAIRAIIIRNPNIVVMLLKSFWIASSIHVFFIILQFILPDLINSINSIFINSELTTINMIKEGKALKGINIQTAPAGLIATLFVGFVASSFATSKKWRMKQIIFIVSGIFAIILTLKRAFLVSSVIGLYFIAFITKSNRKTSKLFIIFTISFVLVIGFIIAVETIPQLQEMIARTMRVGRALSGREQMFEHMWIIFKDNPIVGIGNGYANAIYSYGSHNVYLQLLGESGLIGLTLFTFAFVGQFFYNMKIIKPIIKINFNDYAAKKRIYTSLYMQVVFFLYCLTGNPLYDYPFMVMFMVFFTIPESEIRRLNKRIDFSI